MITMILNEAPYGTEKSYNGLRLALSLAKNNQDVQVYLLADAVFCAMKDQKTPNGYYNVERMINILLKGGHKVYT